MGEIKATPEAELPPTKSAEPPSQELVLSDSRGVISAFANENNFAAAQRMARALMSASMVPQAYRESLPNTLIAMELASRIGASPFMVMQNLDIIHGVPGWRAKFLIATVNTCGRFSALKFRWKGDEGKPGWECRAYATELSSGQECVGPKVTLEIAAAEGWSTKAGSKWKTLPELMMMYRAGAFWTRVYAPELSMGIMTEDEVIDITPEPRAIAPIPPDVPMTRTVSDAAANLLQKVRQSAPVGDGVTDDTSAINKATIAEPGGEPPPPPTEKVQRGRPGKCKSPYDCDNKLTTADEKELNMCAACQRRMTDRIREKNGTAVPAPQPLTPIEDADKEARIQTLVALSRKAQDFYLAENDGSLEKAEEALTSLSAGQCRHFALLSNFMYENPDFVKVIEEAIS